MTSPTLLTATDICLTLGGRQILHNVSLTIERGEIVSLIGPNGAGKTSLLRILMQLQKPHSGVVSYMPHLRLGYVPQRLAPDAQLPLTVARFLALWQTPESVSALSGATPLLPRQLSTLSGGELQRVLLARALANNPELLVLDEPAQALDLQGQQALYALLAELRAHKNCAILMVSHDLTVVMRQTDRVLCLNGHICCAGRPSAVAEDPVYAALFGPAAPAFALYHHQHDHRHDSCAGDHAH